MHKIIISGLKANCIIGIKPEERLKPQEVVIDLSVDVDLSKPVLSDDIADTMDYDVISREVTKFIEKSKFKLVEKLAYETAKLVKEAFGASRVKVTIKKPEAITNADYAGVEVTL